MSEKKQDPFGMNELLDTWTKSMGTFWEQATDLWSSSSAPPQAQTEDADPTGPGFNPKAQEAMAAALKNWRAISGAMASPESMTALFKGSGAMPEILVKLSQSATSSMLEIQQKILKRMDRLGEATEAYHYTDIDENLFRIWTEVYEKEFQRFLNIPQLGLMRTYQEKANQAADKYNIFQSHLSEFLRLLGLPFGRTMQVMQEEIGNLAKKGELPEDPKVYYQMWIRMLEGHFMTLFQTQEYVEILGRTVNSLADFSAARDAVVEDILSTLPVARKTDMDDMARELYELKKRVRMLEKAQRQTDPMNQ